MKIVIPDEGFLERLRKRKNSDDIIAIINPENEEEKEELFRFIEKFILEITKSRIHLSFYLNEEDSYDFNKGKVSYLYLEVKPL